MSLRKLVLLNVGWMRSYSGLEGDEIEGGGQFVERHRYGGEIFNFRPFRGRFYGYGGADRLTGALSRLGGSEGSRYVDDVTVVWVARSRVVGWYIHARLYPTYHQPPPKSGRAYKDGEIGYHAVAKAKDGLLLPEDARTLQVPRGRHGMGRLVWYPDGANHKAFLDSLQRLIASNGEAHAGRPRRGKLGSGWQRDPIKRKRVEIAAVELTIRQYEKWGYDVNVVQDQHLGWDLEAELGGEKLLLEAKGVSSHTISVELTHNEYTQLARHRSCYRVCIVTNALDKSPCGPFIFTHSHEDGGWRDQHGRKLSIQELTAARLSTGDD